MPRRNHQRPGRRQPHGRAQRQKRMHGRNRDEYGESFRCLHCRLDVSMSAPGTAHRNHCPNCLSSKHVDRSCPGDRASTCRARMEPISIAVRGDGEWVIIHRCVGCGDLGSNRAAGDDNALALTRLAVTAIRHLGSPLRIQLAVPPE
ncbi:RNHCP domain-containing protein [Micromonospora sp. CB01531]|uniref:RNHCP domain-containing protein n=1 Tax=Micromonospora sp. CB01531 TaxID=1718947 RepID=UPI000938AC6C|nr:hypothetical protein A6A27_07300 [Micromonospora sp. CB01531]